MPVRLTPTLTSPFSAEKEVSWGSQLPISLLGPDCLNLAHHPSPPQARCQLCTLAIHPPLVSWPPWATCNWHLLFPETGHSEVRDWEFQILHKQGCPLPQQVKKNNNWTGQGNFLFLVVGYW